MLEKIGIALICIGVMTADSEALIVPLIFAAAGSVLVLIQRRRGAVDD